MSRSRVPGPFTRIWRYILNMATLFPRQKPLSWEDLWIDPPQPMTYWTLLERSQPLILGSYGLLPATCGTYSGTCLSPCRGLDMSVTIDFDL